MNFNKFLTDFTDHLNAMLSSTPTLFEVELTPDDRTVLYNLYLDSFSPEHNKLFRERRELDCNACKQFIRNFGGVVIIREDPVTGEPSMETVWNFGFDNPEYGSTTKKLDTFIQSRNIDSLYMTDTRKIGTDKTVGQKKAARSNSGSTSMPFSPQPTSNPPTTMAPFAATPKPERPCSTAP